MKEKIKDYIINNTIINDYFSKVEAEWRDDFKSHIWLIILEMIDDKKKYENIKRLYQADELGKFVVGIINNQLKSNTSSFYKIYKDKNTVYLEPSEVEDIIEEEINTKITIMKIIDLLNNIYYVDAVLFKLYYGIDPITNELTKPKTYQEIQKLIGINYQAVRNSVLKAKKEIKKLK